MTPDRLLLGTHTHSAPGEAGRRQAAGLASLLALGGVDLVNVQFRERPHDVSGIRTLAVLPRDSTQLAHRGGPRKPFVPEIFAALASEAERGSRRQFCFANADVLFSPEAVDFIRGRRASVLFRRDIEPGTGRDLGILLTGADAFAIPTDWWRSNAGRFRPYILGEPAWDNNFASILACHAGAVFENRRGLIRHEAHPTAWTHSPYGEYTRLHAAQDAGYFTLWCTYVEELARLRREGTGEEDERDLARRLFVWHPSATARVVQVARTAKARARYALLSGR